MNFCRRQFLHLAASAADPSGDFEVLLMARLSFQLVSRGAQFCGAVRNPRTRATKAI
jgi:hypothetical protein